MVFADYSTGGVSWAARSPVRPLWTDGRRVDVPVHVMRRGL